MLTFKKYSSIENHFNREFMEKVVAEMPQDLEYVVQEKVHGANTSFLCDGNDVKFAEKKSVKKRNKLFAEPVPYSEELKALVAEVVAYVTENRLTNVVSHIGEVHVPKDFGKIMGLFSKDVLEDFLKEHGGDYACLEKSEQKLLSEQPQVSSNHQTALEQCCQD